MPKFALIVSLLILPFPALSDDAEALFQANGCTACHHPEEDRVDKGLGPSLTQIADAYEGKPRKLVSFLRGDSQPILYPDKYMLMKAQLPRLSPLNDDEMRALANYLLSF